MSKIVVITGASSGLGETLVKHFAEKGDTVCGIARRKEKLESIRSILPGRIHIYPADISDYTAVESVFSDIVSDHGRVDVLVNNAGVFHTAPFYEESPEHIDTIIDTNLKGVMYCTHAVLPSMMEYKKGYIINISSVSGINGIPGQAIYGASKHGVQGFADVIGHELREHNILVTNVCPGGIATPLWDPEKNPYPGTHEDLISPGEIAELIDFILEQPASTMYKKVVLFPKSEWHSDD